MENINETVAPVVEVVEESSSVVEPQASEPVVEPKKAKRTLRGHTTARGKKVAAPVVVPEVVKPTTPTASKYRALGLVSGMPTRVMAYQDATLLHNSTWKLTDAQLVALWNAEFPGAIFFKPSLVAIVRREYNDGKHGGQVAKPTTPSVPYGPGDAPVAVVTRTKRDRVALKSKAS